MDEVLVLSLALPYFYASTWWVVRRDMRRLSPERLARCWNTASFGAAVLGFGPFCVVVHFIKAHGWLIGIPRGLAWTLGILFLPDLILLAISLFA